MRKERIESIIRTLQITQELRAKGYNAEMRIVNKNGLDIFGIEIIEDDSSSNKISPVYYPDKFDGDTREIADQIIENYKSMKIPKEEIIGGISKSFEEVKDKLIICLEPVHDVDYITERYLDLQLYVRYRISNNMSAKVTKDLADIWRVSKEELLSAAIENTRKKIVAKNLQGMLVDFECIEDQVVTLMTTNGQAPFLSVNMYLNEVEDEQTKADLALIIEEVLKQRIQGVKNEQGIWITPAFPKLLYVLEDDNIHEGDKYWYLTKLAAQCTAKRMVPDYISEKKMLEYKIDKNGNGNCYPCMGCRSFLTPYVDANGEPKYYGRFNQGVVTINLPDIALSSNGDIETFWDIFDERTELCHKALQMRHERLEGTLSDVAPILWRYGALARLEKGETIDRLLHNGYSTLSLGYAGLYECVKYMTGKSHTDGDNGEKFGLEVMQALNDKCNKWKNEENIDYSLYGSPIESTTYKFAKCLKKRFGVVEGITDRDYITNSYHVPVFEEIDPFTKLSIESKFQKLSPGGAISYIECADLTHNIDVVLEVMQFIYNNIMYAELNTKSDYCQRCGYDGEIKIVDEDGELIWECPNCGNRDKNKMNVARRTCGYIGSKFWNKGRTEEIAERYVHLDDHGYKEK